jgi:hypothetical protein
LNVPLAAILGDRKDENARQTAAEQFRETISRCKKSKTETDFRIIVKKQNDLWEDGLRAGRLFATQKQRDLAEGIAATSPALNGDDDDDNGPYDERGNGLLHEGGGLGYGSEYGAGKWGKYLRAPSLYFEIMEQLGKRFAPLGEIATIRFGVKSGCDAFFMPRDVSAEFLEDYSGLEWNDAPLHTHCKRSEVESGKLKLVRTGSGDNTVHPIEAKFLKPEVHSPMVLNRPVITADGVDRVILQVAEPISHLRGTYVQKYLRYGEKTPFASQKSKAVPVSERSSCAGRDPWYDLTKTKPGSMFWPMIQKYRHIIASNPQRLICNKRLFDIHPFNLTTEQESALQAVLNSTLVALFKFYYGRYVGTEGTMDTDVIDVNLIEVPDPRHISKPVLDKLQAAFTKLCQRDTQHFVEQEFLECQSSERAKKLAERPIGLPVELTMPDRRALDLAVFELLGVPSAAAREKICDQLYHEATAHFRHNRILDIQKQEQRAKTEGREFRTDELAADLWDSLPDDDKQPLSQWVTGQAAGGPSVTIPDGDPNLPDATDFLDPNTVFFRQPHAGKGAAHPLHLSSRAHAEIVYLLSVHSVHGTLALPATEKGAQALYRDLVKRLDTISATAKELAASRTADEKKADDISRILQFWMVHGKPTKTPKQQALPAAAT